ncbi:MAG: TolB family protein, partial [Woeseiaceae bacterium]
MKNRSVSQIVSLLAASLILSSATSAQESFTIDDALRMKRVGDVTISPNGSSVFYSISSLDWAKNKYTKEFFLVSVGDSSVREYVGKAGGEDFAFSPDGKFLAFLREVESEEDSNDPEKQLFVMPTDGGEAIQISEHPGKIVDFKWSPDLESILFVAEDRYDDETEKEIKSGADPVFVDEAPNGKERARFSNIWQQDLNKGRSARQLTDEELIIDEFDLGSNGASIVFVARPDDRTNYGHLAELYLYRDDEIKRLTFNEAPETMP